MPDRFSGQRSVIENVESLKEWQKSLSRCNGLMSCDVLSRILEQKKTLKKKKLGKPK